MTIRRTNRELPVKIYNPLPSPLLTTERYHSVPVVRERESLSIQEVLTLLRRAAEIAEMTNEFLPP